MTCQITPDCENPVENRDTGLCSSCNHALRKAEREAAKVKVRKPIKKVSDHRAVELRVYNKEAAKWLIGKTCAWPGCKAKATEVHHGKGRENELLMVMAFWVPACHHHHAYATEHSAEAIEVGFSYKRNA